MTTGEILAMTLLTLRVGAVATALAFLPALLLGYTLARRNFPGRSVVQAVVTLPMVLAECEGLPLGPTSAQGINKDRCSHPYTRP